MDIKADDPLNVDIDPALLLSYELDKLNLDNIPNDIFDEIKLTDEVVKNDDKVDIKNDFLLKDNKKIEPALCNCSEIKIEKTSVVDDKSCDTEIKAAVLSECSEIKKDINGNDESVSEENLNKLFVQLELSDSDNEEINDIDNLKQRGPVRSCKDRRASRKKDANNLWCKANNIDTSQFNSERLKFWSGSNQIQFHENAVPNQYACYNNCQTAVCSSVDPVFNGLSQESYFEDTRASSVSSPESGYDSSSAHSITGSPPPILYTSLNLDYIAETEDEQNILEFLLENESALTDNNLSACNTDDKDAKGKITEIINFLKDIPPELHESSNTISICHNTLHAVPFPNHSTAILASTDLKSVSRTSNHSIAVLASSQLKSVPFSSNHSIAVSSSSDLKSSPPSSDNSTAVSASSELKSALFPSNLTLKPVEPKKLVPKSLDVKAKETLRSFLSQEEYHAALKRIYAKISEDKKNGKPISAIYVEDEMEKDSKNRTNLHNAVLNGKIEDIFSIVEIHKQYNCPFADINIRDKHGKTALDYAIKNQMTLVADYLKENTACQSVNLEK